MSHRKAEKLFDEPEPGPEADASAHAPLAERMRPRTRVEFVGRQQLVGAGRIMRRCLAGTGALPSLILWGAPGTGKTTHARLLAQRDDDEFIALSAVFSGVKDVREAIARARENRRRGRRTVLFIDEIHRFNKAQQDALLPAVEDGTITLIGATTENPYYEVNSALISRAEVYELEAHSEEDLAGLVRRGAAALEAELPDELATLIAHRAGGDARAAYNVLELAVFTARAEGEPLEQRHVEDAARKRPIVYDKGGDAHYDFTSAFIKSIRGSDPDAAVYYLAAMLEGGEDARFIARRMVVLASEDIGNADPMALVVAVAAAQAVEHVGLPEARLNLAQDRKSVV